MTYTPIQLEAIKLFGRKEFTNGCVISIGEIPDIGVFLMKKNKSIFIQAYAGIIFEKHIQEKIEILGHIPHLFPDVARELQKEGYVLELLKVDTIKSVLKISRFDIKKDIIISYKKLIPLLDQSEETLTQFISLFK